MPLTDADVNRIVFAKWMRKVDSLLVNEIGLESIDLPDIDWWEMFDQGFTADGAISAGKVIWGAEW